MYNNQRSVQILERDYTIWNHQSWNRYNPIKRWLVWEWLLNWDATDNLWINNGTNTNGTFSDSLVGYNSKLWVWNGTTAYVEIPDAVNYRYQNGWVNWDLSISVWYTPTNTTGVKTIVGKWTNPTLLTTDWIIYTNWTAVSLWILWTAVPCTATAVLTAWVPVHIVGTFTSWKLQSIYIDSVFKTSATETNSPTYVLYDPIRIGQNTWTNWNNWKVQLFRIFRWVLTPKEIKLLHKEWLKIIH